MRCTQRLLHTLLTAFGSPESSGIPRLVHIVFTLKAIHHRTPTQSMFFIYRLDHELQLALYRAVRAFHTFSMAIPSADPDPQLYHVIL